MKNFTRRSSHSQYGSQRCELAQHAHSCGSHAFSHTLTTTWCSAITEFGTGFSSLRYLKDGEYPEKKNQSPFHSSSQGGATGTSNLFVQKLCAFHASTLHSLLQRITFTARHIPGKLRSNTQNLQYSFGSILLVPTIMLISSKANQRGQIKG